MILRQSAAIFILKSKDKNRLFIKKPVSNGDGLFYKI